jgi:hypothetical protein
MHRFKNSDLHITLDRARRPWRTQGKSRSDAVRLDFDRRSMIQFRNSLVTSDAEVLANFELDNVLDSHAFTSNRRNERVRIQSGWIRKSNTTRSVGNVGRHPPLRI